jgi:hypothetical protein
MAQTIEQISDSLIHTPRIDSGHRSPKTASGSGTATPERAAAAGSHVGGTLNPALFLAVRPQRRPSPRVYPHTYRPSCHLPHARGPVGPPEGGMPYAVKG